MKKQIISNFYGRINEVVFFNNEIYYTVAYVLAKLEKHFKVDITDNCIPQFLSDLFYYEYEDDQNFYEVLNKVVEYICDGYKTLDDFMDEMKSTPNPHERVLITLGLLAPYDIVLEDDSLN